MWHQTCMTNQEQWCLHQALCEKWREAGGVCTNVAVTGRKIALSLYYVLCCVQKMDMN